MIIRSLWASHMFFTLATEQRLVVLVGNTAVVAVLQALPWKNRGWLFLSMNIRIYRRSFTYCFVYICGQLPKLWRSIIKQFNLFNEVCCAHYITTLFKWFQQWWPDGSRTWPYNPTCRGCWRLPVREKLRQPRHGHSLLLRRGILIDHVLRRVGGNGARCLPKLRAMAIHYWLRSGFWSSPSRTGWKSALARRCGHGSSDIFSPRLASKFGVCKTLAKAWHFFYSPAPSWVVYRMY